MKRLMINTIACLALCAAAAGCSRSERLSDGRADVKIMLDPGYMSADDPNALEEEGINTLRIVVYKGDSGIIRNYKYEYDDNTRPLLSQGIGIYDLPTGPIGFFVIINEESIGKEYTNEAILSELATSEKLLIQNVKGGAEYFPMALPDIEGSGNGLPMSGYTDIELVENCSVYIPVKRAVAKLNLTISNATSSEIVVNKIIYGYGNNEQATGDPGFISDRCWLFESYNQDMPDGTQYASLIFGANENLGIRIPPSSDAMHVCYIYPCNSDVDSYRLGIETEGETYLPSRFDSNSGTPINHIARNTQVNIFASISSESTIKINFEVTPWTAKSVAVPDFD